MLREKLTKNELFKEYYSKVLIKRVSDYENRISIRYNVIKSER
jgi:hypothetical protein